MAKAPFSRPLFIAYVEGMRDKNQTVLLLKFLHDLQVPEAYNLLAKFQDRHNFGAALFSAIFCTTPPKINKNNINITFDISYNP